MKIDELQLLYEGRYAKIFEKDGVIYKLGDKSNRELLRGQFELLRELDDPQSISVFKWIEVGDKYGYSMEKVTGTPLNKIYTRPPKKKKDFEQLRVIIINILEGLSNIHSRGIIHGDLKPTHIYVSEDNNIKIIDPGYDPDLITPLYAAPEAIMGEPAEASDVYSLGIILYEIVTGKRPFSGSLQEIIEGKLNKDIAPPSDLNPSIPDDINQLILRMTSRRLDLRLKTIPEVLEHLEIVLEGVTKKTTLLPVFVGREKELKFFEEKVNRLPEPNIIWIVGDVGMGRTQFINRARIQALIKGLQVKELSFREIHYLIEEETFPDTPQVLIIDQPEYYKDLILILRQKAKTIRFHPVIILITTEKEPDEIKELSDVTTVLSLSPLSEDEIGSIIDRNFPDVENRDRLTSFMVERTDGIPLFTTQTLLYLLEEEILERRAGKWIFKEDEAESLDLSKGIEQLVTLQVGKITEKERILLKKLSVFPTEIPTNFINVLKIERPYTSIESMVSKGLLKRADGVVRFRNKWIRDFLYRELSKNEKSEIYKEITKGKKIMQPGLLYSLQLDLGMEEEAYYSLKEAAKEKIKDREYISAIELLEKAFSLKKDKLTMMLLARLYELSGRYTDALEKYNGLIRDEPDSPHFLLKVGMNERSTGVKDRAEKNLRLAVDKSTGFIKRRAIVEFGRLFLETGRITEASELLSKYKGKFSPQIQYLRAHISYLEDKPDNVIRVSSEALKERLSIPYKRGFLNFLGLAKQKKEEYGDSIKYFDECLKIDKEEKNPYNEAGHRLNKGFALLQLDIYREAVGELESALSIYKDGKVRELEEKTLWTLSVLYLRIGYWNKLEDRINELKERYKEIGPLLKEKLAYSKMYGGDFNETSKIIKELKEEGEDTKELEAILLSQKGDWKRAENLFKNVLKEVKGDLRRERELSCRLSESLYYQDKKDKAIKLLKPFLDEKDDIKSDFERANLLSNWGFINEDHSYLEQAIELFTEIDLPFYIGKAHLNLGSVYNKTNQIEKAVMHLKQAEEVFEKLNAKSDLETTRKLLSHSAVSLIGRSGYVRTYEEISRLLSSIDSEERFNEALSVLINFFKVERGAIILKEEDQARTIISSYNIDKTTINDATKISSTITEQSAKGEIIIAGDARSDERFRELESVNRNQIRSILCVPITAEDKIYGALYLDSTLDKNVFMPGDKEFLQSMGRLLGILFSKGDLLYRLKEENVQLKKMTTITESFHSIIGISEPMQEIYEIIQETAPLEVNILITGETGTGKELVARTIHKLSKRSTHPFVTVDCSSLTETLLQSELFGHKKGSFTGAYEDKEGMCEKANGGSLFLDEIGDAPLSIQAGLLHVTDRGEIRRVGDTEWRKVNLRIIAATNKNLEQAVVIKGFRDDLYYRLNHVTIEIPPLRQRREDIPLIAKHYLKIFSEQKDKEVEGFTERAMEVLTSYPWPGNIRELKHATEIAVLRSKGRHITKRGLPDKLGEEELADVLDWRNVESQWRRETIMQALNETNGNIKKAAEKLNISRRHLYRLLKKFDIKRARM